MRPARIVPLIQQRIERLAQAARAHPPVPYPPDDVVGMPPPADLAACFARRLDELRAPGDAEPAVLEVADTAAAAAAVRALVQALSPDEIAWPDVAETAGAGVDRCRPPRDRRVGVTPAAALIAATGTVVVELPDRVAAWASLYVDRHVVVADRGQLLPDLSSFYRGLAARRAGGERLPVQVCITGCSRTADIEKLLVIPAHGPRQVRVVLSATPLDWAAWRRLVGAGPQ